MRRIKFFTIAILPGLLFYSCNRCDNLDCVVDNLYGQFRIVNATDGKDLVFGPTKIYDKNQIKFYSLKGADTTFFECKAVKFPNIGYDSILSVYFSPKTDTAYMRLSHTDVDTLNISYNTFKVKCCGTITKITNFRLNNSVNMPGDNGTQEIKK